MRRSNSYSDRLDNEQKYYYSISKDISSFRVKELTEIAAGFRMYGPEFRSARVLFSQLVTSIGYSICMRLGLHPFAFGIFMRNTKPGSKIDKFRKTRGLHKLTR